MVTTPFDVMINQAIELARGDGRHGSCGLGFGETIERNLHPAFGLRTMDLFRPDLGARLENIWSQWLPVRLAALGLDGLPQDIARNIDIAEVIARFLQDCEAYLDHVALWPDSRIAEKGQIIFEGAQGLLLDQDYGAFPHVTRSNTGLKNMLAIATEAGVESIQAIYATRCYVTRHGAGPLSHEVESLEAVRVVDRYDAVIIGTGQAGKPLAEALADAGWRTAIVERDRVGGTCVLRGCTPSKTMVASARVAHLARRAADYGVRTGPVSVDMETVRRRKREIVDSWREGSRESLEGHDGIDLVMGDARFVGDRTLEVELQDDPAGGTTARVLVPPRLVNDTDDDATTPSAGTAPEAMSSRARLLCSGLEPLAPKMEISR
jgi:hypothetical protein